MNFIFISVPNENCTSFSVAELQHPPGTNLLVAHHPSIPLLLLFPFLTLHLQSVWLVAQRSRYPFDSFSLKALPTNRPAVPGKGSTSVYKDSWLAAAAAVGACMYRRITRIASLRYHSSSFFLRFKFLAGKPECARIYYRGKITSLKVVDGGRVWAGGRKLWSLKSFRSFSL